MILLQINNVEHCHESIECSFRVHCHHIHDKSKVKTFFLYFHHYGMNLKKKQEVKDVRRNVHRFISYFCRWTFYHFLLWKGIQLFNYRIPNILNRELFSFRLKQKQMSMIRFESSLHCLICMDRVASIIHRVSHKKRKYC